MHLIWFLEHRLGDCCHYYGRLYCLSATEEPADAAGV